jgi:hypothetical protein
VFPSDSPGVNPATLNGMIPYYRLMTKLSGLGDSTELSRMGLSHPPTLSVAQYKAGKGIPHGHRQTTSASTHVPHRPPEVAM